MAKAKLPCRLSGEIVLNSKPNGSEIGMKLTVPTSSLSDGLRRVLSVVSTRSTLPVLCNVLLSGKDGVLSLSTTDLEVSIVTQIPAEIEREGETTLPARKFGQIVSTLSGETVTLDTDEKMTTRIKCGSADFHIMGLDSSEFPRQGEFEPDRKLSFGKSDFGKVLRKIAYAVSTDQTRYVLNGILLSVKEGSFTAVATDGRRLALVERNLEDGDGIADGDVILPIKVVNELQRLLDGQGDVEIGVSDSLASFSIKGTVITSKLVEGTYPNYRQVIPSAFANSVVLPRDAFNEVLNRVSVVTSDSGSSVKLALSENNLLISASSTEVGEANEPLEVNYQGEDVNISFNPSFLRDPIRNLECDEITVRFNDEFKPVVVLGDEGFLCVIMPMRN